MMPSLATVSAVLIPVTASAEVFGSVDTCSRYVKGGREAVKTLGSVPGGDNWPGPKHGDWSAYLLVTPTEVIGDGWSCRRGGLRLSCSGEGTRFTLDAKIVERGSSLSFTDEFGTVVLNRCDSRESANP